MRIPARLRVLASRFLDVLYPGRCFVCSGASGPSLLCTACSVELPLLPEDCCPQCALPSVAGQLCGKCQRSAPAFDSTLACFFYRFPAGSMVHALKYGQRIEFAAFFADALAGRLRDRAAAGMPDVIVPMPLHRNRLMARGFNQAAEIARPLARQLGLPLELDGIRRLRDTPAQVGLPLAARSANLRGAFESKRRWDGLRVAVVDDVMTTGASLSEVAKVLKRAGAAHVDNWVLVRTQ
jgi:ComF family protein